MKTKTVLFLLPTCFLCLTLTLHGRVKQIKNEEDYFNRLSKGKPTVVEFYADWCSACSSLGNSFEQLSEKNIFQPISFIKVDVNKFHQIASKEGIKGVPAFIYVKDTKKIAQTIGIKNIKTFLEDMTSEISSHLLNNDQSEQNTSQLNPATTSMRSFFENNIFAFFNSIAQFYTAIINKIMNWFVV